MVILNVLILMNALRRIHVKPTRFALIFPPALNAIAELAWNMITIMRKVLMITSEPMVIGSGHQFESLKVYRCGWMWTRCGGVQWWCSAEGLSEECLLWECFWLLHVSLHLRSVFQSRSKFITSILFKTIDQPISDQYSSKLYGPLHIILTISCGSYHMAPMNEYWSMISWSIF